MDRACRSDEDTFKNQHNEFASDFRLMRGVPRQSGDEKDPRERTFLRARTNNDCEEAHEEDRDDNKDVLARDNGPRYSSVGAAVGVCAVCNFTVAGATSLGSANASFEQARSCDQGHLLCQRLACGTRSSGVWLDVLSNLDRGMHPVRPLGESVHARLKRRRPTVVVHRAGERAVWVTGGGWRSPRRASGQKLCPLSHGDPGMRFPRASMLPMGKDMGCVLCRTDSQHSNSTDSRGSSSSVNQQQRVAPTRPRETRNVHEPPEEQRANRTCGNEFHGSIPWARAHSEAPVVGTRTSFPGGNGVRRVESCYSSEWNDKMDEQVREERYPNEPRHHQQRSYCSIIGKETATMEPTPSETRVNGHIVTECSRRPIRCPRLDCAVNVAFSALTHHFLFDHPEVPILSVEPGATSTLIVSFAALSCDSSRCLALLLVSGKLSGPASRLFNGSQIHSKYRNRLPLPVLAARLHCTSRYASPDGAPPGGEARDSGDVIIAWVAGLDIGNVNAGTLRCSIQAVDNVESDSVRSLTYTGPVNSLRTAQRPREVFVTGDCVILHEGLINHITSDCASLNINVIVH